MSCMTLMVEAPVICSAEPELSGKIFSDLSDRRYD